MGVGKGLGKVLKGIIGKLVRTGSIRTSRRSLSSAQGRWPSALTRRRLLPETEARARALAAARHHAAHAGSKANKTAVAVDRRTGQAFAGYNRDRPPIHPDLKRRLPDRSEMAWDVNNCAEVSAANKALNAGSRLDDLVLETVHSRNLRRIEPCVNCKKWVP